MDKKNRRRVFLKHLLSFMAFSVGSILSYKKNVGAKVGNLNFSKSHARGSSNERIKKIAVEEHTGAEATIDQRLRDMDEAGVDMHVTSGMMMGGGRGTTTTTAEIVASHKKANEALSKLVEKYPNRIAGYTSLPLQDPDAAAGELERAVKELGLKGPMIFSGDDGYLDEKKFWVIYEMAEKLDVPIYVHPPGLTSEMKKPYNTYPILQHAMWGYAAGTGLQAMRLIVSGVFDKYPGLKIMLGHMGEALPYWLWRMDKHYVMDQAMIEKDAPGNDLKKKPSEYFLNNFYITTSGMFWHPVLQFAITAVGADRILFATDYPPESSVEAVQFIDSMPISDEDKNKICHLNAEKLLRI